MQTKGTNFIYNVEMKQGKNTNLFSIHNQTVGPVPRILSKLTTPLTLRNVVQYLTILDK